MEYDHEVDRLLNAMVEISKYGVPSELIINALIKNAAVTKCEIKDMQQEINQIKQFIGDCDG